MLSKSYTMENKILGGWEPVNHSIQDFWPESSLLHKTELQPPFTLEIKTTGFFLSVFELLNSTRHWSLLLIDSCTPNISFTASSRNEHLTPEKQLK